MCYRDEKWARLEGPYFISNYGRLFSFKTCKFIKPHVNNKGYYRLDIPNYNDKRLHHFIHIKVVELFGDCNGNKLPGGTKSLIELGLSIDHRDGNKKNNMQSNLELVKHCVNCERKYNKPVIDKKIARRTREVLKTFDECF